MTLRVGAKRHHEQRMVTLAEQGLRQGVNCLPELCRQERGLAVRRHALGPPDATHRSLDLRVLGRQLVAGLLVVVADAGQPPVEGRYSVGVGRLHQVADDDASRRCTVSCPHNPRFRHIVTPASDKM
jgi:hypothetical protein